MVGAVGLREPGEIGPRSRSRPARLGHRRRGTAVVLAYPLWFLLRGPAHLTGPIWSNGTVVQYGNTLTSFWRTGGLRQIQAFTPIRRLSGSPLPASAISAPA